VGLDSPTFVVDEVTPGRCLPPHLVRQRLPLVPTRGGMDQSGLLRSGRVSGQPSSSRTAVSTEERNERGLKVPSAALTWPDMRKYP
jgi:hypothetical protein